MGLNTNISRQWNSPWQAKDIAKKNLGFSDLQYFDGELYWQESRPGNPSSSVIVHRTKEGILQDVTDSRFFVAGVAHGYGGGSFVVGYEYIYFFDTKTKRIVQKEKKNGQLRFLISEGGVAGYSDFCVDAEENFLYSIKVSSLEEKNPKSMIVRIDLHTLQEETIAFGYDFYSNIRIDSNRKEILFLRWNAPHMPWDQTELMHGKLDDHNNIIEIKSLYKKDKVSIYQPEFGFDGVYAAIDKDDFWKLVKFESFGPNVIFDVNIDCGRPLWVAGTKSYNFLSEKEIIFSGSDQGIWKVFYGNVHTKHLKTLFSDVTYVQTLDVDMSARKVALLAGKYDLPLSILETSLPELNNVMIKKCSEICIEKKFIPKPQFLEIPTQKNPCFANYYAPKNSEYSLHGLPPCVIKIHGGPTSQSEVMFNPKALYYTSRGFAFVEINYRGSSGFGKKYRDSLYGLWGELDVQDVIACGEYLIKMGLADKAALFLSGGSAGGFTVLNTLISTHLFLAASSHYGISHLHSMSDHIPKFEASYDINLLGDSYEKNPDLYEKRSPLTNAHKINTPLLLFHGDKDPVVHYSQSEMLRDKLIHHGKSCEYYLLPGEGHGFKKEENIEFVVQKEYDFFLSHISNE